MEDFYTFIPNRFQLRFIQTPYVGTAQSINYITYNRNANYIPAATAIVTK